MSEALKELGLAGNLCQGSICRALHIQRLGNQTSEFIPSGHAPRIPIQLPSDSWTNLNCIYAVSLQRLPACGKAAMGRKDKNSSPVPGPAAGFTPGRNNSALCALFLQSTTCQKSQEHFHSTSALIRNFNQKKRC